MICKNKKCGAELVDGAIYCHICGKKQIAEPKKYRKRPNGTGTVYKKNDGRRRPWAAEKCKVLIGYYATRAEAVEALEKLSTVDITERYNMTFEGVYEEWKVEHFREVSAKGAEGYEIAYKHFQAIHNHKFRALKTVDYQREIDKRIEAGKSRASTEKDRQLIGQMCKWAMREEIINVNYAQFLKLQKPITKEKEIFTEEDIKKLTKAAATNDAAKIVCMLIGTGMRIGELFDLPLEDCYDKYVIGGEKSEAGRNRVIPIRPEVRQYFEYFKSRAFGCEKLIEGYSGNRTVANFRKREYYPLLEDLGIKKKVPHTTRHTYASRARAEGMAPEVLQKILGHVKYTTTAEIYVHSDINELVEAVELGSNKAVKDNKSIRSEANTKSEKP